MTTKVFVYGTLKQGEPNYHWLTDAKNGSAKFVTKAETVEKYPLIIATQFNIPFLLNQPGTGHNVKGEIYEIDKQMLGNLDILEDYPNYYSREIWPLRVLDENGKSKSEIECWVYFLKEFRQALLERPMLESYSNLGDHNLRYCEKNNESTVQDLEVDLP